MTALEREKREQAPALTPTPLRDVFSVAARNFAADDVAENPARRRLL